MRFIDLFAGVGGFRLGMESAGHECVWSCEIDKYCKQVYKEHFGDEPYGDISAINPADIPDHDILCGGFPCQDISIAGKRAGLKGKRSGLFYHITRIAETKKPRYTFLENVKGLISSDRGWDFARVLIALDETGYDEEWDILNTKEVLPQNRERVFIIGHLRGQPTGQVFPIGEGDSGTVQDSKNDEGQESAWALRGRDYKDGTNFIVEDFYKGRPDRIHSDCVPSLRKDRNGLKVVTTLDSDGWEKRHESIRRVYGTDGIAPTIPTAQGGGQMTKIAIPVLTPERLEKRQNGRRFKEDGEEMFTLTKTDKHGVAVGTYTFDEPNKWNVRDGFRVRRLTPTECERLQGFPDGWTSSVSDSQRYKMMGNAVTVAVIARIAEQFSKPAPSGKQEK